VTGEDKARGLYREISESREKEEKGRKIKSENRKDRFVKH